ncbi:MAG TPA: 30S ribosome-binding factor RbfA [Rhizobiales bacterium]|nr:30S ribosome-binding factor RbfA [Hyphomicrobiales bacterium]
MGKGSQPSQRQLRVGELVRHALSGLLLRGETGDPLLEKAQLSVLEVSMSPDLRQAKAYVRTLTGSDEKPVMQALWRNRRYIRKLLAPHLKLKYMPDLGFEYDHAADHAAHIEELLHDPHVVRDLAQTASSDGKDN